MRYRLIPAKWKYAEHAAEGKPNPYIREGEFQESALRLYNRDGYNIYFFPNDSKDQNGIKDFFNNTHVDNFKWVMIDIDLKDGIYASTIEAVDKIKSFPLAPTVINTTGNGVHAFWRMKELDARNYVELQQKLITYFQSDESVYTILQLMRVPGYYNVKDKVNPKMVENLLHDPSAQYIVPDFAFLPELSTYRRGLVEAHLMPPEEKARLIELASTNLPEKFSKLLNRSDQIKDLFLCKYGEDRSSALWKLCHQLVKLSYTREEILCIAVNTEKGKEKGPEWVQKYIMNDIFTHDIRGNKVDMKWKTLKTIKDTPSVDNNTVFKLKTHQLCPFAYGYRPGDVLGLIGGSGAGKSTVCLNIIREIAEENPEFLHVYISLEMSQDEIFDKISKQITDDNILSKLILISNENDDGTHRDLSLQDIDDILSQIKNVTGLKIGVVVLDNINILDHGLSKNRVRTQDEHGSLKKICKDIKQVAKTQEVFWITQSQSSREKAGEGDIMIFQDAAYGTSKFENYCSFVITLWQPLKNQYAAMSKDEGISNRNLRVLALRYCKNRFQRAEDKVFPGEVGLLSYILETDKLVSMTEREMIAYHKYQPLAQEINKKSKKDRDIMVGEFAVPKAANGDDYEAVHKLRKEVFSDDNDEGGAKPTPQ